MSRYPLQYDYATLGATLPFEFAGSVYTDPMRESALAAVKESLSRIESLKQYGSDQRVGVALASLPQPAYGSFGEFVSTLRRVQGTLADPSRASVSDFVTAMSLSKRLVTKADKVSSVLMEIALRSARPNAPEATSSAPAAVSPPKVEDVSVPGRIPAGTLAALAGVATTLGCVGLYEGYRDSTERSVGLRSLDALGRAVVYASILGFVEVKLLDRSRK
jgi:hypothetical protein